MTADVAALQALAVDVARRAGQVLLDHRERMAAGGDAGVTTKTSATDPVSAADAASERLVTDMIAAARPDDGLLGEEGADRPSRSGLRWVVDPLDGTVNFLYGHPGWAVSIAVEQEVDGGWEGLVGVVLDPVAGEEFVGARGGQATRGGVPIRVNDPVDLPRALVATGFSYDVARRVRQAATATRVLGAARDIRRVGSAALDLCGVACGRVDAYYEDTTQRWDWAAGAVIVRAAGGVVTPLVTDAGRTGVMAAGPALHPALAEVVAGGEDVAGGA